ncbi:MAG: apolipoprotein N-acyltransferase [Methylophaga sp.]|nr:apolipoprotein N-acyltransferase [Methylophaga sp.]
MMSFTKQGGSQWQGNIIALLAGMALPLAFSPFHYYPIAIISLMLLFLSLQALTAKQAAVRGYIFGLGFFGVGISWVYVAIHDFGGAGVLLAGLLTAIFVAFLAIFVGLITWGSKKLTGPTLSSWDYLLLLPVAWLVFEWIKIVFLTGFPWLELGISQIDGPLRGYTPIVGVLGVSLLVTFSAGLLAATWQSKRWWLMSIFIAIWIGGYSLNAIVWTHPVDDEIKVSIIQGNIPQATKWDPKQIFKTLALYQARTEQHWDSDLIVWPENATPIFYHQAKELFFDPLGELAQQNNTDLLIGLPVKAADSNKYYNSMMSLGSNHEFYYKRHLVPFGEFVPFAWLRGLIAFFDLPMSSFEQGPETQGLFDVAGQKIGASICFEDVFSREILTALPEATILVNASNNGWYGDSLAPHQHLQISQNRALETGRSIVRATTNGISAFIDERGNIRATSKQFEEQVLTAMVQPRQGVTPYVAWGQRTVLLMSLFMLMIWAYHRVNFIRQAA